MGDKPFYVQTSDYEGPDRRLCPAWQFVRAGGIKPGMLILKNSAVTPTADYPSLVRRACAFNRGHKGKHCFARDFDPKQYESYYRRKSEGTVIVT